MHPLLNIAIKAARGAGELIIRNMDQLDRISILTKSDCDFFTEIDVRAEQLIIQTIHKAYPEHGIIAEESGCQNPNADTVWIIDPLDGTTNFIHGFPYYAVSIAVRVKNRIEHAVVYDPLRHECFTASRGRGAQLNDRRIRVSKQTLLNTALIAAGFPARSPNLATQCTSLFSSLIGNCAGMRKTGSAALDLAYVACGRLDGCVEYGLKTWDIAAASLIIKEAGGLVADPLGGDNYLEDGNITAGTPKIFKALLQLVVKLTKNA